METLNPTPDQLRAMAKRVMSWAEQNEHRLGVEARDAFEVAKHVVGQMAPAPIEPSPAELARAAKERLMEQIASASDRRDADESDRLWAELDTLEGRKAVADETETAADELTADAQAAGEYEIADTDPAPAPEPPKAPRRRRKTSE